MKKHLRYISLIFFLSLRQERAYPLDNFILFFSKPLLIGLEFLGVYFLYTASGNSSIAGFSQAQMLIVLNLSYLTFLCTTVIPPGTGITTTQISNGKLDPFFLRPQGLFFSFWTQRFYPMRLVEIALRFVYLLLVLFMGHLIITPIQWFSIGVICLLSIFLFLIFFSIGDSLSFWFPFVDFNELFFEFTDHLGYYPNTLYPKSIQLIFTYILPFFLLGNPMYQVFSGTYSLSLFGMHFLIVLCWLCIAIVLWSKGIQRYDSAN